MKVAVVTGGRSPEPMGLETAEARLLEALAGGRNGTFVDVRVVGGRGARRYARRLGARWYPAPPNRASRRVWRGAELLHLAGLTIPPPARRRFLATFHDLSPLHFGDEGTLPPWTQEIADRAELLFCPSRFTASELGRELGVPHERIRVVPNGPGHDLSPTIEPLADDELAALGIARPFLLRLGGYTERKNVPLLLAAWPAVRRRHEVSLALVGPAQAARAAQLAQAPSLAGVAVLDYLPAELVPRLLRSATALVSTSTYEGFGLPALEAMAAGTPVVAVRAPAVEEVCGSAGLLVENDPAELARALVRLLTDGELRRRLAAAGLRRASSFSWARSADAVLAVYRELA